MCNIGNVVCSQGHRGFESLSAIFLLEETKLSQICQLTWPIGHDCHNILVEYLCIHESLRGIAYRVSGCATWLASSSGILAWVGRLGLIRFIVTA